MVLPYWKCIFKNKNNNGKITNFIKTTKMKSPTGSTGATSLPPVGSALMYIETSGDNYGHNRVFVVGKELILFKSLIYFSIIMDFRFNGDSNDSLKSMGRFRIQLLLEDNTWSTRYNIPKIDRYGDTSTQWTLVNLNFTVENYGVKLVYDQIDTPHADMCLSNITITHSVY